MRGWVIERLMCEFELDFFALEAAFGSASRAIILEARQRAADDRDGIVSLRDNRFVITERGKPFVRTIASWFDAYLGNGVGRHSIAV